MSININNYVNINSSVAANQAVPTRQLGGRFITENPLVPTGTFKEFTSLDAVGAYFSTSSTEYARAQLYFGWESKDTTSPNKMSFARWANVATASQIFGIPANYVLSNFTGVTAGDFTLTMGGFTHHLTGINLSAAGSLSAVAADIQSAVQGFSGGGTAWTSATVTYDATRKCFDLTSGTTGTDVISVTAGVTTDLVALLGWGAGAIFSNGSALQSVSDVLTQTSGQSDNFGSFAFIPTLQLSDVTAAANWNDALNNKFMYSVPVTVSNASAWSAALNNIGGTTLTLAPISTEYPEQVPMMILDATNYLGTNSVQNYMFQEFNLTPSVTTDADKAIYDGLSINYYGQTQTAGQQISFYQNGVMMGLDTDALDQNTYSNEIWLKDALAAALLQLLLTLSKVSANLSGLGQVLTTMQTVLNQAVTNGTISVGKPLDQTQKLYITNKTGDPLAWQTVQNSGYWRNGVIAAYVVNGVTKFKIVYTLIYSKDDDIRLIEGSDVLI